MRINIRYQLNIIRIWSLVVTLIMLSLFSNHSYCQLKASYAVNTCNCDYLFLKNVSKDTVYIISQSESIYEWDSCFAYDVFKVENKESYDLNITHIDFAGDSRFHRQLYVFPDSTFKLGVRANDSINNNKLFISLNVYAMPIKKGETINGIRESIKKIGQRKNKTSWEWRKLNCLPQ